MKLVIMTRGRVGRQETLKWIPDKYRDHTWLICPNAEIPAHDVMFPWVGFIPQPPTVTNYSQKFQWLVESTHLWEDDDKIVIMDDDLYFNRYEVRDGVRKLCVIKDRELLTSMFDLMDQMLDKIPLVGVHPRMMANTVPEDKVFEWNSKIVTIQGFNRALLPNDLPRVDQFPILADVFFNCALLSRGYPNARITTYFVDWLPSQAAGGCDYRTADMQRSTAEAVASLYPEFVTVVKKTPKSATWLTDGQGQRTDLKIRWKAMYEAGAANRGR